MLLPTHGCGCSNRLAGQCFDLPFEPGIDEVDRLTPIELLLWNTEPCPDPPTRDYPGMIEKVAYRLVALGVFDSEQAKTAIESSIPSLNVCRLGLTSARAANRGTTMVSVATTTSPI